MSDQSHPRPTPPDPQDLAPSGAAPHAIGSVVGLAVAAIALLITIVLLALPCGHETDRLFEVGVEVPAMGIDDGTVSVEAMS